MFDCINFFVRWHNSTRVDGGPRWQKPAGSAVFFPASAFDWIFFWVEFFSPNLALLEERRLSDVEYK